MQEVLLKHFSVYSVLMDNFKQYCGRVLQLHHINAEDTFGITTASQYHLVSYDWVIETYMQTSQDTQEIFKAALEKAILQGSCVATFFQEMGQMAVGES